MSDRMTFWLDDVRVFLHDDGRRGKLLDPRDDKNKSWSITFEWLQLRNELDEGARALLRRLKILVLPDLDGREPRRSALVAIGKALSALIFATQFTLGDTKGGQKNRNRSGKMLMKDSNILRAGVTVAFDRCRTVFREAEHLFVTPENEFRRDGAMWVLKYEGQSAKLKHRKGFPYIKELNEHPTKHVDAVELIQRYGGAAGTCEAVLREDGLLETIGGASLPRDRETGEAWGKALDLLQEEVDDANASGDTERITEAQSRLDLFKKERSRHYNYRGVERDSSDPREKARKAVGNAIHRAIKVIDKEMPLLGRHLGKSIKSSRGSFVYNPERQVTWNL